MNNNAMLFECKNGIQRIDITYTIHIPKYNKTYTGTSSNSYILINTGNNIYINKDDEIYIEFTYGNVLYNKYYKYLGDGIAHVIDVEDPLNLILTLNYVHDNNVYNIEPVLDTNVTIDYIRYKLYYQGGLASEVNDTNIEDILLVDTIKNSTDVFKVYFLKDGTYKLVTDVVDINNNIKTIEGNNIVISSIDGNTNTSSNMFRNKISYIEWE